YCFWPVYSRGLRFISLSILKKMSSKVFQVKNRVAMQKFAAGMAREIAAQPLGKHAKVVALVGDLGAGKTTFTQGFLKALGVKRRVISPTFLIMRPYKIAAGAYHRAIHIDCYRLEKPQELIVLGFKEVLAHPGHIVLIEWPELMKKYLPKDTMWIAI